MALLEHDPARLLADAASMATMAAGLERETPTVELLMGIACEKMFLAAVGDAVADPSTDRETLTTLQKMVVDTDLRAGWRRSNLALQAEISKHVAAVISDPLAARQERLASTRGSWSSQFGKIFQAQQLEIRADLIAAVDQPLGLDPPWFRRGVHQPRTIFGMFDVFESVMFGQSAKSSIGRVQSTLSLRELARIALAVRLQGLATGSYPETLASLPGSDNGPIRSQASHLPTSAAPTARRASRFQILRLCGSASPTSAQACIPSPGSCRRRRRKKLERSRSSKVHARAGALTGVSDGAGPPVSWFEGRDGPCCSSRSGSIRPRFGACRG